jgi:hypothetical protein
VVYQCVVLAADRQLASSSAWPTASCSMTVSNAATRREPTIAANGCVALKVLRCRPGPEDASVAGGSIFTARGRQLGPRVWVPGPSVFRRLAVGHCAAPPSARFGLSEERQPGGSSRVHRRSSVETLGVAAGHLMHHNFRPAIRCGSPPVSTGSTLLREGSGYGPTPPDLRQRRRPRRYGARTLEGFRRRRRQGSPSSRPSHRQT